VQTATVTSYIAEHLSAQLHHGCSYFQLEYIYETVKFDYLSCTQYLRQRVNSEGLEAEWSPHEAIELGEVWLVTEE
jgi:hypothetical protein